jgi:hypothetical protein
MPKCFKSTSFVISYLINRSNPKGMALIMHALLCYFDHDTYYPLFSVCWFPYTMVEMKEFKSIALSIQESLVSQAIMP